MGKGNGLKPYSQVKACFTKVNFSFRCWYACLTTQLLFYIFFPFREKTKV